MEWSIQQPLSLIYYIKQFHHVIFLAPVLLYLYLNTGVSEEESDPLKVFSYPKDGNLLEAGVTLIGKIIATSGKK